MPSENELPDLKHLCSQVFSGVGYMHSKEIIASRRVLLFQEAVKLLHFAGVEGKELEREMSVLDDLIENHLSTDGNTRTNEATVKPQKSTKESNSNTKPDRIWAEFTYEDGAHYIGQTLDDKPDGKGTLNWPSGNKYEGDFLNGEPHGEGTLIRSSGSSYSGGWYQGKFNGFGKQIREDGTITEGQHIDGKLNGYASEDYPDGSSYKGEWKDNGRHGHGVFKNKKGKVQSGQFVNGRYSPPRSAIWTGFKKAGMAFVFLVVMFGGYSFYQSLYSGVGFFQVLENRRNQVVEITGLERFTKISLGTGSGVAMDGIGDMKLYEEDVAVLDTAKNNDPDAQVEFAKVLDLSNTKEAKRIAEQTEELLTRYVPEMLTRINEFSVRINCNLDIKSYPFRKTPSVWSYDVARIQRWQDNVFEKFNECLQAGQVFNHSQVWHFIYQLFGTVQHPITKGGTERRWGYLTYDVFAEHVDKIAIQIDAEIVAVYNANVNRYDAYYSRVIKRQLKNGRKEERKFEKEEVLAEFVEKHGYGPNETCVDGSTGKRFRCLDGLPQGNDPDTSWIGEMADEANRHSQKQAERSRILQHAHQIELRLWSESQQQQTQQKQYQPMKIQNKVVITPQLPVCGLGVFGPYDPDANGSNTKAARNRRFEESIAGLSERCKKFNREQRTHSRDPNRSTNAKAK